MMKSVLFGFSAVFQQKMMKPLGYLTEETGILPMVKMLPSSPVL